MKNAVFETQHCSVARALEQVGDWWTLLIVREALFGTRRFSDFQGNLGIAKNVLSERLSKLVEAGIFERTAVPGRGNPQDYTLTAKGRDLFPVVVALMQWGDRWIQGRGGEPLRVIARSDGKPVTAVAVRDHAGTALEIVDVRAAPGPNADDHIKARFGKQPRA